LAVGVEIYADWINKSKPILLAKVKTGPYINLIITLYDDVHLG